MLLVRLICEVHPENDVIFAELGDLATVASVNRDDHEVRVKLGCMRSDSFMARMLWVPAVLFFILSM